MEKQAYSTTTLIQNIEEYGKTTAELVRLRAVDFGSQMLATLIYRLGITLFLLIAIQFFGVGLALLIGNYLGKWSYGFFALAAFFILLVLVMYVFLFNWIKETIITLVLSSSLNHKTDAQSNPYHK